MERAEPKIVLLVRLLNAIDEGRYSFEELKRRISEGERSPSTRSLRRYLAVLSDAGFPWFFDRSTNAYRFAEGYSLKRLDLTPSELFGLVALRSLGASLGGTIGAYVDDVTEKLLGSAGRSTKERVEAHSPVAFRLSEVRMDEQGEKAFSLLSQGERASRSVRFTYVDKEGRRTERTVDPYGFIVSSGRIYLVGFDHLRSDTRVFAVDNVAKPEVLAKTFTRPRDFNVEAFAAASISGVLHSDRTSTVRIRFSPRVAKAAIAARVVAHQDIERRSDGAVEITYRVADVDELLRWALGWGAQAEVIDPLELRGRMLDLIGAIRMLYNGKSNGHASKLARATVSP
ncbi:MAG: WYL domain-containing protein [Candidatus Eremiobacteraeota bacterium]|nr:WYL domain-containing protein [Candidatus Eremiobacteraeota bacterium]